MKKKANKVVKKVNNKVENKAEKSVNNPVTGVSIEQLQAQIEAMQKEQARLEKIEKATPIKEAEIKVLVEKLNEIKEGCTIETFTEMVTGCIAKLKGYSLVTKQQAKQTSTTQAGQAVGLSVYGHKMNSMAAILDNMLVKGATYAQMQEEILANEKFANKEVRCVVNKISGHISYLKKRFYAGKSIKVENNNGVYTSSFQEV